MAGVRGLTIGAAALGAMCFAVFLSPRPADAGEFVAVEVGSSGEILKNSAIHQTKHYLPQDADLDSRIATVLADMDELLLSLHVAAPQLAGSPVLLDPSDSELGELFALALENNPQLWPLRSETAVHAARTRQEGAKQDPMLGLELDDLVTPLPVLQRSGDLRIRVMLSQQFESYGKRGLRREIAHYEELKQELELKQQELDVLLELTEVYYELAGMRARLRSLEQNIRLMGVLIELANRKYALGVTPLAAVMAAQVEQAQMETMRIELANLIRQQESRLEGLLGRPKGFSAASLAFDAMYPLPAQIDWDNPALLQEMLCCRPDYQLLETELEQRELQLELAQRQYRPDYRLSAEYSVSPMGQDHIMAGVEIPLFTHKEERQDAMVQEAHAEGAVSQDRLEALENELQSGLENYQYELRMHAELVKIYRSVLVPQARLALDSNIAAYSANMMDLSELIMSQQSLLTQEQELEQNYIHILHTLADLQIYTCGVFDPAPYLEADPLAPQSEAAGTFDLANQAIAESSYLQDLQAQHHLEEVGPRHDPRSADLFSEDSFIEGLELPAAAETAGPDLPQQVDAQAESESEGVPASEGATTDETGFYEPFRPSDTQGEAEDG